MNKNRLFTLPFLLSFLFFLSFGNNYAQQTEQNSFVVVLDAGHGGHDPGNLGNGYLEKNIALNIVLRIGRILEQNQNVKVIYTRKDDTFIDLYVRGEIANKAQADLFVSVHCDSHSSDANGAGTFVLGLHANEQNFEIAKKENSVIYLEDNYATRYADYDINSPESVIGLTIMQEEFLDQSIALAKTIQDNFSNKLKRKNRKVKQAGFIVLHQTFMPSVLVETGFLTNDKEGAYLNSSAGQSQMGASIADAILRYKANSLSRIGVSSVGEIPTAPDPENTIAETEVDNKVEVPSEDTIEDSVKKKISDTAIVEASEEIPNKVVELPAVEKKVDVPQIAEKQPELPKEIVVTEVNEAGRPKIVTEEIKTIEDSASNTIVPKPEAKVIEPVKIEEQKKKPEPVAAIVKKERPKTKIEYRVQIMASAKNLSAADSKLFNGLTNISKEPYKNLYRYMHGRADNFADATVLKKKADSKGYTSSYLVAYKDGVRIDVKEARKISE